MMKMKDKRNEAGSDKSRSNKHGFRPGQILKSAV
jgi:hypothetical protein